MYVHVGTDTRILVFLFLFCVGFGTYVLYQGYTAGDLAHVDLVTLELGQPCDRRWIEVTGVPHAEWSYRQDEGPTLVPVVSPQWGAGKPVALFLDVQTNEQPPARKAQVIRGVCPPGRGLGRNQRRNYGERGFLVADSALVIDAGKTPEDIRSFPYVRYTCQSVKFTKHKDKYP